MRSPVEIRLLGSFSVRRPDGTTVAPRAWRTRKSRDLLRILAVNAGTPVPTTRLLEALWPAAEPTRGRANLRTAATHVRQVIGRDSLARRFDGLVLQGAWVDAVAFASLAGEASRLFARGELADGMAAAREAAALYAGDLCADEPYAEWAVVDRERLCTLRMTLLAEAADAAVALGRHREAIDLAGQVIEGGPASERAYRVLMRAYFALGETDGSLRAYERCREALVTELGVDPAPETRALHLELLSTGPKKGVRAALTGRDAEVESIRTPVAEGLREGQATFVIVSGPQGSGRTRLADEACAPWSDRLVKVPSGADGHGRPRTLVERVRARLAADPEAAGGEPADIEGVLADALESAAPLVLRLDDIEGADPASLETLRHILADLDRPVAVVATSVSLSEAPPEVGMTAHALRARGRSTEVSVGPLTREAVDDLLAQVLTERAAPALLEDVMAETGGHPGQVVRFVRDLSTAGRLTVTHLGVERVGPVTTGSDGAEGVAQRVREVLSPSQVEVFDIVSVLGDGFTAADVAGMCRTSREDVREALGGLLDDGILAEEAGRYRFREARVAEAAYRWLRPSARRELHERVAASPGLSESARIEHWYAAGEPQLACAAALHAAEEAAARGQFERQRAYLRRARSLTDLSEATPEDRLALAESLGDACHGMTRFAEARGAFEEALALARSHAPGEVARLSRKLGDAASRQAPTDALVWYRTALTEQSDDPVEWVRVTTAVGGMLALRSAVAAERGVRSAVRMADDAGHVTAQVEARVVLASRVLVPTRRFAAGRRWLQEALATADTGNDHALLAQVLAATETTVALGSSLQTVATLSRVDELARRTGQSALARDARLLLALAAHELAADDFPWRWATGWAEAAPVPGGVACHWVPGRVLYERGHLAHAGEVLARSLPDDQGALDFQLVRLPAALLAAERGDTGQALALLRAAADRAVDTGVTMLLPEIAARLAALEAPENPVGAAARLDRAETALGETVFPREQGAIMLARAALLAAAGRPHAAADMAAAAGLACRAAGLVFGRAEALTVQAGYLVTAGAQPRALAALRRAGDLYRLADAPARVRATSALAGRLGLDWEATAAR